MTSNCDTCVMPRRAQIAVSPQLIACKMACVCFEEGYIGTPSRAIEIKGRPNITRGNYTLPVVTMMNVFV